MLVSLECVLIIAIVFLWRFHIFDLTDKNERHNMLFEFFALADFGLGAEWKA